MNDISDKFSTVVSLMQLRHCHLLSENRLRYAFYEWACTTFGAK